MYRLSREKEERRLELWGQGLSDKEIAKKVMASRAAIRSWRLKWKLPANPEKTDRPRNLYEAIDIAIQNSDVINTNIVLDELRKIIPIAAADRVPKEYIERCINKKTPKGIKK